MTPNLAIFFQSIPRLIDVGVDMYLSILYNRYSLIEELHHTTVNDYISL